MGEQVITTRGLTKRYGTCPALSDVALDVRKGEVLELLGPIGSGKTTLRFDGMRAARIGSRLSTGHEARYPFAAAHSATGWRGCAAFTISPTKRVGSIPSTSALAMRPWRAYHKESPQSVQSQGSPALCVI